MQNSNPIPLEKLRFPIGRFENPASVTAGSLQNFISDIEAFPSKIRHETEKLSNQQLDTPYRPDGWTIRQVVNHCADSHMNALVRFKLALTEDKPVIKPYFEALWAELPDSRNTPVEPALQMLEGIHARWAVLLRSLDEADLQKSFIHPEHQKEVPLQQMIAIYAWHGNHHLAHITQLKKRMQWE